MLAKLAFPLATAIALLAFGATATAQRPVDPASKSWGVEVNGVTSPTEVFGFTPDSAGATTGTWINFDGNKIWGWGTYEWDPTFGHLHYVNRSGDGGGFQEGTYSWTGTRYVRTWASHPKAPPMELF